MNELFQAVWNGTIKRDDCPNCGSSLIITGNNKVVCADCAVEVITALTARIKKLEGIVTELKEDSERLANKFTTNNVGFLMCIHCGQGMNTHSPDCAIELHRQLMKRIEEEEK